MNMIKPNHKTKNSEKDIILHKILKIKNRRKVARQYNRCRVSINSSKRTNILLKCNLNFKILILMFGEKIQVSMSIFCFWFIKNKKKKLSLT